MIEIDRLVKRFGTFTAVDGVSFTVPNGHVMGFLGPNGAGKSTTMRMITGYLIPTSGRALVGGLDVVEHPVAVKRMIGYLPEGAPTYPDMTAAAFLDFIARIRGLTGAQARRRLDEVIERLALAGILDQPIDTLSKGFKRRVALAQAILHDPPVLILDEPTDGLDPNQKHQVRELIRDMAPGKAIVISTHILEEVEAVCDGALIIGQGRVLAEGAPKNAKGDEGWRFGGHDAAPGRLDAVFRAITLGGGTDTPRTPSVAETPPAPSPADAETAPSATDAKTTSNVTETRETAA